MQLLVMLAMSLGMLVVVSLPEVVLVAMGVDVMSRPVLMWTQAVTQFPITATTVIVPRIKLSNVIFFCSMRSMYILYRGQR